MKFRDAKRMLALLAIGSLFSFTSGLAPAQPPDAKGLQFFEKNIRPVLVQHCYECHSAEGKKAKGGLQLDTRNGLREGGDNGPSVVSGNPAESLILKALRHEGPKMPSKDEKLSDETIALFQTWIEMGAPDPREGKSRVQKKIDYVEGRKHWAYQPVKVIPPPKAKDAAWARGEIDRYILAKIEEKGIKPAPDAANHTLIRRLTFDLTGLPPTVEEVDNFGKAALRNRQAAIEEVVDRLLASKQFGVHWARHWFDGIRYNPAIVPVDRYRKWVVAAYNEDLPYDQFVLRQLAGDLLTAKDDKDYDGNLTATQLLCMNMREPDLNEAMIEVVGQQFLAVSINCAKCHDHKYDSFSQADYYALAGIFSSTRAGGFAGKPQPMRRATVTRLRAEDAAIPACQDAPKGVDVHLLINGEDKQLGDKVLRKFPVVLAGDSQKPLGQITEGSGRLELARWIADPQHPLTARVMVNRLWQRLLTRGIVATPNDFGTQGEKPTHPELLDYLADRFVKSGWSTKTMIREIVLSHTYQQGTRTSPEFRKTDLENALFSRASSKRLQFEQIIDNLYFVANNLILEEPSLEPEGTKKIPLKLGEAPHRAIYGQTPVGPRVFDGASPQELVPQRETSITSPQLLFFFNNASVVKLADALAKRAATSSDAKENVTRAYRLLYARSPTDQELAHATQYLQRNTFARYCHVLLCAHEFVYLD